MVQTLILALVGIVLVVLIARLVRSKPIEILLFGSVFALFEAYHFYGEELFHFPAISETLTIIVVAGLMFWTVLRILSVVGIFVPVVKLVPNTILGGN